MKTALSGTFGIAARNFTAYPEMPDAKELVEYGVRMEELGFDSIWTTSHYFSPYQMTGSALQQATFMAGRTRRVDFGTMVVILPWQHPLHVATEIALGGVRRR